MCYQMRQNFTKENYKVLHMLFNNPRHQDMLGVTMLERQFAEKGLRVLLHNRLDMTNEPTLQRRLRVFFVGLGKVLPRV